MKNALFIHTIVTPIGELHAAIYGNALCMLEFINERAEKHLIFLEKHLSTKAISDQKPFMLIEQELSAYFNKQLTEFSVPLYFPGTTFQEKVWESIRKISYGKVISYAQQAQMLENPKAIRAMAHANGQNRISIVIPCHRIIGSNGQMTGYGGEIWRKEWLLQLEKTE